MRLRITVKSTGSRTDDLRLAADLRGHLWARAPVELDADNPLHGTHRDQQGRAYIEFSTQFPDEVTRILEQYGFVDRVELREAHEPLGPACQKCGNIPGPVLPTVCPNCGFRDISPCPVCHHEIPRQHYSRIVGDLFHCPHCHNQVRLRFNHPLFVSDGTYNQPLVVTEAV
jgi:hypothetical protein